MKHFRVLIIAVSLAALPSAAVAQTYGKDYAMKIISKTSGTYSCRMLNRKYAMTFVPIFSGRAMNAADSDSRQLIIFDTHRHKWIDEYIGTDGSYSVMEGAPASDTVINFVSVYPSDFKAKLQVKYSGNDRMETTFTAIIRGKQRTENDICVKAR